MANVTTATATRTRNGISTPTSVTVRRSSGDASYAGARTNAAARRRASPGCRPSETVAPGGADEAGETTGADIGRMVRPGRPTGELVAPRQDAARRARSVTRRGRWRLLAEGPPARLRRQQRPPSAAPASRRPARQGRTRRPPG